MYEQKGWDARPEVKCKPVTGVGEAFFPCLAASDSERVEGIGVKGGTKGRKGIGVGRRKGFLPFRRGRLHALERR